MDESKENRKIETKELVRQYLKRKYPDAQFSDIDLDFLVRYSVKKEPSANTILKSIGNDIQTEQAYYNAHPAVKAAKDDFQYIYGRFSQKQKDYKNAFNGSFEAFLAWWCEKTPENGIRHCCYCGIDENTLKDAFKNGLVISKKPSFSGELQIERKDPDGDYCNSNCEFACVICNNAKSDMISAEDFTKFFVPGIKEYWEHIEEKLKCPQ